MLRLKPTSQLSRCLQAVRPFAWKPPNNEGLLDEAMAEGERKALAERRSEAEIAEMKQNKLNFLAKQRRFINDPNNWFNKLRNMDEDELKMIPYSYMRRYGAMMHFIKRMEEDAQLKENRTFADYYRQIYRMDRLMSNEEKAADAAHDALHQTIDEVTIAGLIREEGDLFRRQPRIDPSTLCYNFEQYRRYTDLLASAKEKDDAASRKFYKMVRYVQENQTNLKDSYVRDFIAIKGYDPNMVHVPEEF